MKIMETGKVESGIELNRSAATGTDPIGPVVTTGRIKERSGLIRIQATWEYQGHPKYAPGIHRMSGWVPVDEAHLFEPEYDWKE